VLCEVCASTLNAGDLFCASCGAVVPDTAPKPPAADIRDRIAGERKYLTVLCVDLQRSTDLISELDPESAITRLEPALNAMRVAVRRNRGIVSKEGGDGLIALFGAPHADDNHAVMACHAGLELVHRIKLLGDAGLQVRVGIHSGYVVAHVIEADFSSIYEAGGPAVHLVKRLEGAAQAGQIVVSESCHNLASGLAVFNPLPSKRLEGFAAPIPCYELSEIRAVTRWRARTSKGLSSFVGRADETSQLQRAAQEVGASGQVIALVGTAGIGKSRMAHEFLGDLRQQNWQVLEADGNPLEQAVPFALFKKLLQNVLAAGDLTVEAAAAVSVDEPPLHCDLWPAALQAVLDQRITDPRWGQLELLLRRRLISDAVLNAVDKVLTRPTVLLVEDLHWVDGQSEAVIEAVLSLVANRPLLVLLTWRTENTPGWLARLEIQRILLRSLDADSARELLDDLLGAATHLDDVKAHVLRHTGQVPLFIEEVARQLLARGLPEPGAGRSTAGTSWEALEVPPTVQGVIASRIDRLPREDKTLLQLAAAVGPRVSPQLLAVVTGMPMAQLQSRLWSLEIVDFLAETRWLDAVEYEFAHDLIREVAYDSILRSQRGELHQRILTALEAGSSGREEQIAEALCQHAQRAQDWLKADRYGHMAAKKALSRSAFREAREYFGVAIDAIDKQPISVAREQRAVDLRIESRLSHVSLGDIERWLGIGRDGEARAAGIGDEGRRLASITIRAAALNFYATPYEAVTVGEEAVALAKRLANMTWLGLALYGLGQSHFLAGRYREADRYTSEAIAQLIAHPNDVPPGTTGQSLLILCYMMKALICAWLGDFDQAEHACAEANQLARASERPYDMVAAEYGLGSVQIIRGHLDAAESSLDRALRVAGESEVRLFLPLIMCGLGNLYSQKREAARARDILLQAKTEADTLGHATSMVVVSAYLGTAYSQLGEVEQGLGLVRACQAGARQKGYGGIEMLATFSEANILAAQGTPTRVEAMDCLRRAAEIASRLEAAPILGTARAALGRLLADAGRTAEAQQELMQALAVFERSKMTVQTERLRASLSKFSGV
jgi:class 3 adenylate cyclase/tetratricopeptide (TPR) repeat protein